VWQQKGSANPFIWVRVFFWHADVPDRRPSPDAENPSGYRLAYCGYWRARAFPARHEDLHLIAADEKRTSGAMHVDAPAHPVFATGRADADDRQPYADGYVARVVTGTG